MTMKLKLFCLVSISLCGLLAFTVVTKVMTFSSAYIYGYPLLLMQQTQQMMLSGPASENQITHNIRFPDHTFRTVVRPNVDTLYSIAWLNLSAEPHVLSVPDMGERYYISPFMDAWTNVFDSVGTRKTGNQAGDYVIVGPNWSGELPSTIKAIHSPTNTVWMIQRIQTKGPDDIAEVAKLQQQFSLASLSQWYRGESSQSYIGSSSNDDNSSTPHFSIEKMNANEFFSTLARLLQQQPFLPGDNDIIDTLAKIGVTPGDYSPAAQGWLGQRIANIALNITRQKIKQQLKQKPQLKNGWAIFREDIGTYGTHYELRTGVAIIGLGALPAKDALYTNSSIDSGGETLIGENRYHIHFESGQIPPVNAFWSITLYDQDGYLVENTFERYALGNRDALIYNDDGSLDIILQSTQPTSSNNNWLPTPKGKFVLTLRLYSPKTEAINGNWTLPLVIKQ
jgi:hypothetical protein